MVYLYRYSAGTEQVLVQVTGHYYRERYKRDITIPPLIPPEGERMELDNPTRRMV